MGLPVRELLTVGKTQLMNAGVEDAETDSKILFCYVKKFTETDLRLAWQYVANDDDCDKYFQLIDRRCTGEPTQYITGNQNFFGYDFKVNENVLIPRRDTEILVDDAKSLINEGIIRGNTVCDKKKDWEVLDLCTGSGVIGITLSKECGKSVKVTASDLSQEALEVAKENAEKHSSDIKFVQGDLLKPFKSALSKKKFNLIISNPPYIESDVIPTLQIEVREHEPLSALDGGKDGLDFYREIITEAPVHLKKNGVLMFEIGNNQRELVTALLEDNGNFENIYCFQDLASNDRVVVAKLKSKK